MTDPIDSVPEVPPADEPLTGLNEVSGPAAFKARQQAASEQDAGPEADPDFGEALVEKVRALEAVLVQSNDQLLRTVAEMDNLRKRSLREREDASKYAISGFAKDLLDVADNFRRALEAIPAELKADEKIKPLVEGIEATERALLKSFDRNGIRKIEPFDEPFNPNFHEVMFEAPAAGKAGGTIIQLIEVGYMLHDRLLRPARVGVAKGDPGAAPTEHQIDTSA